MASLASAQPAVTYPGLSVYNDVVKAQIRRGKRPLPLGIFPEVEQAAKVQTGSESS
jgi:hypothetical protein